MHSSPYIADTSLEYVWEVQVFWWARIRWQNGLLLWSMSAMWSPSREQLWTHFWSETAVYIRLAWEQLWTHFRPEKSCGPTFGLRTAVDPLLAWKQLWTHFRPENSYELTSGLRTAVYPTSSLRTAVDQLPVLEHRWAHFRFANICGLNSRLRTTVCLLLYWEQLWTPFLKLKQ